MANRWSETLLPNKSGESTRKCKNNNTISGCTGDYLGSPHGTKSAVVISKSEKRSFGKTASKGLKIADGWIESVHER